MSLSSRLKNLLDENPSKSQAGLARATGAKPASISDWVNGRTKSINSKYLTSAALYFVVNSDWLATGKGPKEPQGIIARAMAGLDSRAQATGAHNDDDAVISNFAENFAKLSPARQTAVLALMGEYGKNSGDDGLKREIANIMRMGKDAP
jgi:hypothetical protein